MKYPYFRGLEADRYSFYRVPKALIKVDLFEKMSGDAKLLYAVLLDRMNLSLKNGWQDENGNAYIICTIDEIMDSIRCARQKAVKLLDELEHEYQLIERRRQGLGKPNLLYVKDLYAGLSQSNYWKYENQTSGGLKSELPGVWKSNGSKTDINNTDSSETDLIYSAQSGENISGEMREDERYRFYFQDKLEIPILEKAQQSRAYAQKVKISNLQQMAKTVAYIQENGFDTRENLQTTYDSITLQMHDARQKTKDTETQIKSVNEQIHYLGQYLSTKSTYNEFLKARFKGKFRKDHADEIEKHEKAVQILKAQNPDDSLPKMKDLKLEKERLLALKAAQYDTYTYYKDYQKELRTACANVDNILGQHHIRDHTQRTEQTL
mgnify:CR=1 FL=1